MKVKVYGLSENSEPRFEAECDLAMCFPDETPDDYSDVHAELLTHGQAYCGGGAAPAYLLVLA